MAVAKMKKVCLIGHQTEKDCTLSLLQRMAVMEVSDLQGKMLPDAAWAELVEQDGAQGSLQELEARLQEVRFALDFLNRHYPQKKTLLNSLEDNRIPLELQNFKSEALARQQKAQDVYRELRQADEKLMALRNEETRLQNLRLLLQPWEELDLPLQEIRHTAQVCLESGVLPAEELAAFRTALTAAAAEAFLAEVHTDRDESFILTAYAASSKEALQEALRQFTFNRQIFTSLQGTAGENLQRIKDELEQAAIQRRAVLEEAGKQAAFREQLNLYGDYLVMERDKNQLVQSLARTENAFVMDGWVKENDLARLVQKLALECKTVICLAREPEKDEPYPVAMENPPFVAPYEFITSLYGTPKPRGIDPTLALTPFFVAFFGLCMSDGGYGVIIAALGAWMLWKVRLKPALRHVFKIVFACGLSTIFFGALIGGWFGGLIPVEPFFFNALVDPMRMLIYALGIGIFQIFTGMGIMFYWKIKEGKWMDAVFDQLFWVLFLAGLIMLALPQVGGVGRIMAIGAAVGLVLTQGRTQKGIVKKILSGLFSLYNVTAYLGDILSYSRLLALGLATSVIAMSVNMLSAMLGGTIIGTVFMVIMLLVGHLFNLVINILGAYVHSSRLQYLEFFNRFFESGGRPFKPFKMNTNHVNVAFDVPLGPEQRKTVAI